jgi:hypothetical protein
MTNASRIGSIDFWRGAVLVAILVDHIPGNVLEFLTPRNFGLSDSSEAFVFLSGLSVGMVYVPRARKHGLSAVARGCLKRALKLYGVHIALTLAALAIFAAAYQMSGLETLIEAHGRSYVFSTPASGLAGLALLSHQLGYFNILPLYVVLMLWSPLALALTLRSPRLSLLVSFCLYAAARALGLHLPNWPEPGGWFFNPLTWQLVFTAGLFSAVVWRDAPPRPSAGLIAVSVATIVAAAMVATSAGGVSPGFREAATAHLDIPKQDLGLARLAHFFALAYLAAVTPSLARLVAGPFGRSVQSLGRNSLAVFACGSLLSAGGQAMLAVASPLASAEVEQMLGIAYTLTGVAALFAFARWIECRNPSIRVVSPSVAPQPL